MSEDLDPKWNEPATRGDLRLLAMRIDTKFDLLRGDFRNLATETDAKFDLLRGDFRLHTTGTDSKFDLLRGDFRLHTTGTDTKFEQFRVELMRSMYRAGRIFFGAIISTILSAFGIFAILIK